MKKTKTWDRTAYAKTGWRNPNKGKSKAVDSDGEEVEEEEHEEEEVVFEQFPQATDLGEVVLSLTLVAGGLKGSFVVVGYSPHTLREPIRILTYG